jgi:GNAT superfamily N-acetyltransferase
MRSTASAPIIFGRYLRGHLEGRCQVSGVRTGLSRFLLPQIAKKLPRYPLIPATLLGRLAVDERHHGEGIGEFLLMDALIAPGRNPAKSRLWRLWSRPLMNGPSGFTSISDSFLFRQSQAVYSL